MNGRSSKKAVTRRAASQQQDQRESERTKKREKREREGAEKEKSKEVKREKSAEKSLFLPLLASVTLLWRRSCCDCYARRTCVSHSHSPHMTAHSVRAALAVAAVAAFALSTVITLLFDVSQCLSLSLILFLFL